MGANLPKTIVWPGHHLQMTYGGVLFSRASNPICTVQLQLYSNHRVLLFPTLSSFDQTVTTTNDSAVDVREGGDSKRTTRK